MRLMRVSREHASIVLQGYREHYKTNHKEQKEQKSAEIFA